MVATDTEWKCLNGQKSDISCITNKGSFKKHSVTFLQCSLLQHLKMEEDYKTSAMKLLIFQEHFKALARVKKSCLYCCTHTLQILYTAVDCLYSHFFGNSELKSRSKSLFRKSDLLLLAL